MQGIRYAAALLALAVTGPAATPSCQALASLEIPKIAITSAALAASSPGRGGRSLPEFCRITATSRPAPDSEIRFEVWLPSPDAWNHEFVGTGNGGYSGALGYRDMETALARGYATAGSNTGHEGDALKFAVGHPEKINDWAFRAVHVMTDAAKLIVRDYYGRFADHAYFTGCSTGGHQALSEAQRYPGDYDGIVAGDPGNDRTRLNIGFLWSWLALNQSAEAQIPASKLPMLHHAVIAACDTLDGLKDGLISDPGRCKFDPGTLLCRDADESACLTPPQVEAVRTIYSGARNPRTGEQIFPGWAPGSETGWGAYFVGKPEPARLDFWRYWIFGDPAWDPRSFDFDRDVEFALSTLPQVNANNPDLTAFEKRGGKLIEYQGWADPVVPPEDSIQYYNAVTRVAGPVGSFYRLFMAPGMGHCGGGEGPNTFDALGALDNWVAKDTPPDRIVASHSSNGHIDRTRPLCPYPQIAKWNGKGSMDDAASFSCVSPR